MNVQILVLVRKDTNVGTPWVVIVVKTSTNVQLKDINAIEMLTVLIFSADTTVYVTLVMKVMGNVVLMWTSASRIPATIILYVKIFQALINASNVQPAIVPMDRGVLISMNVILVLISAIAMLDVKIEKELIVANVKLVILAMVEHVAMLMNVHQISINVIVMLTVLILLAATIAFVTLVTKVMVNGVMMLTNVSGTHVIIHLYVVIHPALMNASAAQPVIMQVDHVVLILMNVLKASISVIRTLDVEIQKALIVAIAIPAILEMVEIAVMLMSVQQTNTTAKTDIDALTQSVASHVKMLMNARPISIDVTQTLYVETLLGLMTVPVELVIKVN